MRLNLNEIEEILRESPLFLKWGIPLPAENADAMVVQGALKGRHA